MKRLYKLDESGWLLLKIVEETEEVMVPTVGTYRIEQDIDGGSTIIFDTEK